MMPNGVANATADVYTASNAKTNKSTINQCTMECQTLKNNVDYAKGIEELVFVSHGHSVDNTTSINASHEKPLSEGQDNLGYIDDTSNGDISQSTERYGSNSVILSEEAQVNIEVGTKVPDIGRGLTVIVTICNCILIAMATGYVFALGVLLVGIIDEFQATRTEASPILSVFGAIIFGGGGVIGPLMNRFNGGTLCVIGSVLASIGLIITFFAPSLYVLVFSIGVMAGAGLAVPLILAFTTTGDLYDKHKDTMVTVVSICPAVGALIFPYMTSKLVDIYDWRGVMLIYGALVLNFVPIGYINAIVKRRMNGTLGPSVKTNWKDILDCTIFKNPLYLVIVYCVLFVNTLLPILNLFFVDMMRGKGFDVDTGSFMLSVNGFANMAGRILITFLTPFLKCARVGQWCVYLALVGLLLCLYVFVSTHTQLLVVSIMYGLFWGMAIVSYPAMLLELSGPKRYTTAMGYCNLIGGAGGLIGGPVAGLIKDITGNYDLLFFGGACVAGAGSFMLGFMYIKIHCLSKD
ncbi:monocarboxylate transporter 13 isoform X2 [Patella vulgata]|uniref:monocarboxylate transporter 13 isoform X2 n=1 Tax=Patella vulgata TaxID=6465 RepID=UPI0021805AB7|nr:monocarboxylate transporter 13 isoform X2 [Patella vulgata]